MNHFTNILQSYYRWLHVSYSYGTTNRTLQYYRDALDRQRDDQVIVMTNMHSYQIELIQLLYFTDYHPYIALTHICFTFSLFGSHTPTTY